MKNITGLHRIELENHTEIEYQPARYFNEEKHFINILLFFLYLFF